MQKSSPTANCKQILSEKTSFGIGRKPRKAGFRETISGYRYRNPFHITLTGTCSASLNHSTLGLSRAYFVLIRLFDINYGRSCQCYRSFCCHCRSLPMGHEQQVSFFHFTPKPHLTVYHTCFSTGNESSAERTASTSLGFRPKNITQNMVRLQ